MKAKTPILGLITAVTLFASSLAVAGPAYQAQGRVLKVTPIYEEVVVGRPEKRCWDERVPTSRGHGDAAVPTIAGAIVGGVVGNQIGKGSGNTAATVAGALLGGAVGNQIGHQREDSYRVERRCERVGGREVSQEVVAYRVKYEYRGKVFWTRTKHHPGRFIDLDVNVHPSR